MTEQNLPKGVDVHEMPYHDSNVVESEVGFYETNNNVRVTENSSKNLAVDKAALDYSRGLDPVDGFNGVMALPPEEYKGAVVESAFEEERQRTVQTLNASLELPPEQVDLVVQSERQNLLTLEQELESNKKLAPMVSYVNSIEGSERLTAKDKKSIAADMLVTQTVSEIWDDLSKWGVVKDFLGMMVVPDDNWNTAVFANKVNPEETFIAFEDPKFWQKFAAKRGEMSPEEQVLYDEKTLELLEGVDDNQMGLIMNLMRTIGHDTESVNDLSFESIELGTTFAGIGVHVVRNLSKFSKLVTAAKAGNTKMTKFFAEMSMKSETGGSEVGVSPLDTAVSGNSVNNEFVGPLLPGAIPPETSAGLRNVMDNVDRLLDEANDTIDIDQTILGKDDVDRFVESFGAKFSKDENISNIRMEDKGGKFEITYDVINEDGDVIKMTEPLVYTKDDIGVGLLQGPTVTRSVFSPVASPNIIMGKDRVEFVENIEIALHQQAKVNNDLNNAFNAALKPIRGNKKSLDNLNALLHKLNGKDVEADYDLLVNRGYGGVRLNDQEFVAWSGIRRVMDKVHTMNNRILREEMQLRGIKSVDLGNGRSTYARAYEEPSAALRGYEADSHSNVLVINPDKNVDPEFSKITIEDIKDMQAKGYKLVKSDSKNIDDTFQNGNKRYKFAFVKDEAVGALDDQVLNKVPNYMPRSYKDANFFIRVKDKVMVDGKETSIPRTVAFATTKAQAQKWMKKRNEVEHENGLDITEFEDVIFEGERAIGEGEDAVRLNGGLVRGSRSKNNLEYAGDTDVDSMTNDPLNTVQDALNFTAKRMPMSRYRIGLQERLYNELDKVDRGLRKISWGELRGAIDNSKSENKTVLLSAYDQIDALVGVPTKAEQSFQGLVRSVAQSFDRRGKDKIAGWLYRNSVKNPVQAIKNASFQLTLGSFSVVQLPIQMMSALNAFAVSPKMFTNALPRAMYAGTYDNIKGVKSFKALDGKKSAPKGFEADYRLWEKSGFRESVVQTGGDFGSIARGQPYDAGMIRRAFDATVEGGQFFFKSGELWNRRFSFFTALEEVKGIKGSKFNYSDRDLMDVMARAEKMMLGMGAGNKAPFQKGFWGLPMQFKQIYTKSIEAYTGDWFTKSERASIGAVQMGLFGAAGIPIVSSIGDAVIANIPGSESWSESELTLAKRGVGGWLVNDYLDVDAAFSGRMTSSVNLYEEYQKSLVDDVPLYEVLLGASLGPINNAWKVAKATAHESGRLINADDLTPDMLMDAASVLGATALNVPAGTRNAIAAYDLYHNKVFRDGKGRPIWQADPTLRDAISRAIGYQSQEKEDLYELAMSDRALKEKRKLVADQYTEILYRLTLAGNDDRLVESYKHQLQYLKNDIKSWEDGSDILKKIENNLKRADGKREELIEQALKNRMSEFADATNKTSVLLRGNE